MEINLTPIGFVRNAVTESHRQDWQSVTSEIIVNEDLTEALSGINAFSHIIVIFWMHRISPKERCITKVHPRKDRNLPLTGIFATRSPARPNPIGLSTVKLVGQQGNILRVTGLDAVDGTPVLDIKPHIPGSDSPTATKIPGWLSKQ